MTLQPALFTAVFDKGAEQSLDLDTERTAIAKAKLGDRKAFDALLLAYAPTLRKAVSRHVRGLGNVTPEELGEIRQDAVTALFGAVGAFDGDVHNRLAALAPDTIRRALSERIGEVSVFTVPSRSLRRFFGILREADGDVTTALDVCLGREMDPGTFRAILTAVRGVDSYDALATLGESGEGSRDIEATSLTSPEPISDAEDRILVEAALRAIDGREKEVVLLAYGFADYRHYSDEDIAELKLLEGNPSRATVQRLRTSALVKMRAALGVA